MKRRNLHARRPARSVALVLAVVLAGSATACAASTTSGNSSQAENSAASAVASASNQKESTTNSAENGASSAAGGANTETGANTASAASDQDAGAYLAATLAAQADTLPDMNSETRTALSQLAAAFGIEVDAEELPGGSRYGIEDAEETEGLESEEPEEPEGPQTFDFTEHISTPLQEPYWAGCEPAALTAALQAMGYEVTLDEIVTEYLDYAEDGDWVNGYNGDVYYSGMTYPPCIVNCANKFLTAQGSSLRFKNYTGASFDDVLALIDRGIPVLVWSTMYMEEPWFTGVVLEDYEWYENEHCVTVYGVDENGDILVMDPLEGLVVRDRTQFQHLYEECGCMAVALNV